jgi:lipoprotein-anchoring transpeptidase ErfK/SrfK
MRRILLSIAFIAGALALALPWAAGTSAAGPQWVIVNPGETLTSIAVQHGVSVESLMRVNNLPNPNFVYSGQRLLIPDPLMQFPAQAAQNVPATQPQTAPSVYYTVRAGDTLAGIASRYGVSIATIAQANNLTNWNFVWHGQRLRIPGAASVSGVNQPATQSAAQPAAPQPPASQPAAPSTVNAPTDGKWIDVNVTNQTITAYEGNVALKTILVSTGLPRTPTVLGTYKVLRKYPAVRMTGGTPGYDYYDLPNVPYTMFFFQGYAIHGTYWHTNFGHPMSHGCVNLPTDEAKWFYEWAPVGTPVVSHR